MYCLVCIGSVSKQLGLGYVLSSFELDVIGFMSFSTDICYLWTLWIGTYVLSLILRIEN